MENKGLRVIHLIWDTELEHCIEKQREEGWGLSVVSPFIRTIWLLLSHGVAVSLFTSLCWSTGLHTINTSLLIKKTDKVVMYNKRLSTKIDVIDFIQRDFNPSCRTSNLVWFLYPKWFCIKQPPVNLDIWTPSPTPLYSGRSCPGGNIFLWGCAGCWMIIFSLHK